uniref:Uncharacterized protein n=1 Tax=Timema poppense TaxID=170557 RepID=A0A7R9H538_TIMPO|nr:unnamed protein product [Timema poppensis]
MSVLTRQQGQEAALDRVTSKVSISGPIWLLMMDSSTTIPTFFNQIYVPFDCEFLVAQCNDKGIFPLTEVYRIANGSPLHQSYYGTWDYYRGLVTSTGLSIYSRRNNLFGLTSICVTNKNWPMNELVRGVDGKMHSIGFLGQTWELLASRANLSVVYTQPEEGEMWGKERNDGNWTGMIGMLQRHEAEVAISTFAMSSRRLNVISYTTPIFRSCFQMFIRPQQTTILHWGLYFSPFSPCLWIALLATVMMFGVYVYILQCISTHCTGVEGAWSFTDTQLCVIGTMCGQDQSPAIERDISKSVHLATLTIYFTGMILLAAYSGVLVSHFAVNKETLPFKNLQGFLKDGRYTFGILNQSAELEIFQDAKYGILNTVYRRHIARDSGSIAPSIFKGLLQACTVDKYVFLTPEYLAKAIIPRLPCKLVAVSDCIMKSNMAMAVTATSPYHGLFEYILQRLLMGGVLQKLYLGSFSQVSSWHSSWEKVGLEKVAPLLALLAIGCALAVLVLVGEMNSKTSLLSAGPPPLDIPWVYLGLSRRRVHARYLTVLRVECLCTLAVLPFCVSDVCETFYKFHLTRQ